MPGSHGGGISTNASRSPVTPQNGIVLVRVSGLADVVSVAYSARRFAGIRRMAPQWVI